MRRGLVPARLNIKVLIITASVLVVLAAGAVTARYLQREGAKRTALAAGNAAYEQGNWETACKELRRYLEREPDDVEVLRKYGQASLSIRPRSTESAARAIGAYRRLLRVAPDETDAYERLAELYSATGDMSELAYVARKRLESAPDDADARLWLATAMLTQRKLADARELLMRLVADTETDGDARGQYVTACAMLGEVLATQRLAGWQSRAYSQLAKCTEVAPQSARAWLGLAIFQRTNAPDLDGNRSENLAAARENLLRAATLNWHEPSDQVALCREWLEHNALGNAEAIDHATGVLSVLRQLEPASVSQRFPDPDDWEVVLTELETDLLLRRGLTGEAASLADSTLGKLKHEQHRLSVLPSAIHAYLADDRLPDAREALDEYEREVALLPHRASFDERLLSLKASLARAEDRPYEVIRLLELFLNRTPTDALVLKVLAETYTEVGQNRQARQAWEQYAERVGETGTLEATLQVAHAQLLDGQWQEAERLASMWEDQSVDARLLRIEAQLAGAAAATLGDSSAKLEKIATELGELREQEPGRARIHVLQAALLATLEDSIRAESTLREAIDECSEPEEAEAALVRMLIQADRIDDTIAVCEAARDRRPASAATWIMLADALEHAGHNDEAQTVLQAGRDQVATNSGRHALALRLATLQLAGGQREAGTQNLIRLAEQDPSDLRTRLLLLDLPEIRADATRAQGLITEIRAIENGGDLAGERGLHWRFHQAAWNHANAATGAKDAETRELLEACLASDPGYAPAALLLGDLLSKVEELETVEHLYDRTLSANPAATRVADRLLGLLEQQYRFEDARRLMQRLDLPAGARGEQSLRILLGARDIDAAIDELTTRVTTDPADVEAQTSLAALAFAQSGDADASLARLAEAEAAGADPVRIGGMRIEILRRAGRTDEARTTADALVGSHQSFEAYHIRAQFLAGVGQWDAAEQDCLHLATFADRPDGFIVLGDFHAATNRFDDAIATWDKGLASFPGNTALKRRLLGALLAGNTPEHRARGEKLLDELCREYPGDAGLRWTRAILLLEQGTPDAIAAAEGLLEEVVHSQPHHVDAHLRLIHIAQARGDLTQARERAILATETNSPAQRPDAARLLLARAEIEANLGDLPTARTMARRALSVPTTRTEAALTLARLARRDATEGSLAEASNTLQRLIERGDADTGVHMNLALLHASVGEFDKALATLEQVPEGISEAERVDVLLLKADLYADLGNQAKSDAMIDQATEITPDTAVVRRHRISLLGKRGETDAIAGMFATADDIETSKPAVLTAAAGFLARSPDDAHRTLASDLLSAALDRLPATMSDARVEIAGLFYVAGRPDQAEQVYTEVLQAQPGHPRACNDWAWILANEKGAAEEALSHATRGLEAVAPHDSLRVNLLDTRAGILLKLERVEDAYKDYLTAMEQTVPESAARARALLKVARVCIQRDDTAAARRHLRQAQEIDEARNALQPGQRAELAALLEAVNSTGETD